jgi:hypothetical protein
MGGDGFEGWDMGPTLRSSGKTRSIFGRMDRGRNTSLAVFLLCTASISQPGMRKSLTQEEMERADVHLVSTSLGPSCRPVNVCLSVAAWHQSGSSLMVSYIDLQCTEVLCFISGDTNHEVQIDKTYLPLGVPLRDHL